LRVQVIGKVHNPSHVATPGVIEMVQTLHAESTRKARQELSMPWFLLLCVGLLLPLRALGQSSPSATWPLPWAARRDALTPHTPQIACQAKHVWQRRVRKCGWRRVDECVSDNVDRNGRAHRVSECGWRLGTLIRWAAAHGAHGRWLTCAGSGCDLSWSPF
jgi:hypothetical protein